MPELIDKTVAYNALKHEADTHMLPQYKEAYERAARIIDQIHTIESVKPLLSDDERRASELWCEYCDHIEMCKWYPTYGCDFRKERLPF